MGNVKHGKKGRIKMSGLPRKRKRDSFFSRYPVGLLEWASYKRELKMDGKGFQINEIRVRAARRILDRIWLIGRQFLSNILNKTLCQNANQDQDTKFNLC